MSLPISKVKGGQTLILTLALFLRPEGDRIPNLYPNLHLNLNLTMTSTLTLIIAEYDLN